MSFTDLMQTILISLLIFALILMDIRYRLDVKIKNLNAIYRLYEMLERKGGGSETD